MGAATEASGTAGGADGGAAHGGRDDRGGTGVPAGARRSGGARVAWGLVVGALAAACWFAWLGWDSDYQVDAAGVASGPYEAWQVAGCVVSLAAVVVLGTVLLGARATVVVTTLAFTVAWSVTASADETGLWAVGAVLVLLGVAVGASVVAAVTAAVLRRRRSRAA